MIRIGRRTDEYKMYYKGEEVVPLPREKIYSPEDNMLDRINAPFAVGRDGWYRIGLYKYNKPALPKEPLSKIPSVFTYKYLKAEDTITCEPVLYKDAKGGQNNYYFIPNSIVYLGVDEPEYIPSYINLFENFFFVEGGVEVSQDYFDEFAKKQKKVNEFYEKGYLKKDFPITCEADGIYEIVTVNTIYQRNAELKDINATKKRRLFKCPKGAIITGTYHSILHDGYEEVLLAEEIESVTYYGAVNVNEVEEKIQAIINKGTNGFTNRVLWHDDIFMVAPKTGWYRIYYNYVRAEGSFVNKYTDDIDCVCDMHLKEGTIIKGRFEGSDLEPAGIFIRPLTAEFFGNRRPEYPEIILGGKLKRVNNEKVDLDVEYIVERERGENFVIKEPGRYAIISNVYTYDKYNKLKDQAEVIETTIIRKPVELMGVSEGLPLHGAFKIKKPQYIIKYKTEELGEIVSITELLKTNKKVSNALELEQPIWIYKNKLKVNKSGHYSINFKQSIPSLIVHLDKDDNLEELRRKLFYVITKKLSEAYKEMDMAFGTLTANMSWCPEFRYYLLIAQTMNEVGLSYIDDIVLIDEGINEDREKVDKYKIRYFIPDDGPIVDFGPDNHYLMIDDGSGEHTQIRIEEPGLYCKIDTDEMRVIKDFARSRINQLPEEIQGVSLEMIEKAPKAERIENKRAVYVLIDTFEDANVGSFFSDLYTEESKMFCCWLDKVDREVKDYIPYKEMHEREFKALAKKRMIHVKEDKAMLAIKFSYLEESESLAYKQIEPELFAQLPTKDPREIILTDPIDNDGNMFMVPRFASKYAIKNYYIFAKRYLEQNFDPERLAKDEWLKATYELCKLFSNYNNWNIINNSNKYFSEIGGKNLYFSRSRYGLKYGERDEDEIRRNKELFAQKFEKTYIPNIKVKEMIDNQQLVRDDVDTYVNDKVKRFLVLSKYYDAEYFKQMQEQFRMAKKIKENAWEERSLAVEQAKKYIDHYYEFNNVTDGRHAVTSLSDTTIKPGMYILRMRDKMKYLALFKPETIRSIYESNGCYEGSIENISERKLYSMSYHKDMKIRHGGFYVIHTKFNHTYNSYKVRLPRNASWLDINEAIVKDKAQALIAERNRAIVSGTNIDYNNTVHKYIESLYQDPERIIVQLDYVWPETVLPTNQSVRAASYPVNHNVETWAPGYYLVVLGKKPVPYLTTKDEDYRDARTDVVRGGKSSKINRILQDKAVVITEKLPAFKNIKELDKLFKDKTYLNSISYIEDNDMTKRCYIGNSIVTMILLKKCDSYDPDVDLSEMPPLVRMDEGYKVILGGDQIKPYDDSDYGVLPKDAYINKDTKKVIMDKYQASRYLGKACEYISKVDNVLERLDNLYPEVEISIANRPRIVKAGVVRAYLNMNADPLKGRDYVDINLTEDATYDSVEEKALEKIKQLIDSQKG